MSEKQFLEKSIEFTKNLDSLERDFMIILPFIRGIGRIKAIQILGLFNKMKSLWDEVK